MEVILSHRASPQGMSGYQVPGIEDVPEGIGDEVGLLSARVPPQFLIDAREDNFPSRAVPLNFHASVGLIPGGIKDHGSAGVVVGHHQIEHGVIQCAINTVRVHKVAVIEGALLLGGLISCVRRIAVQKRKARLRSQNVRRWGKKGLPR